MAPENQAPKTQQSSGGFWMPLMAGYMMGRLMGGGTGFAQQPLFSSKTRPILRYGKYTDAAGKTRRADTAGRGNDRTENRDGAETGHHNNRYPRRFWRIRRQTGTMQRSAAGTSTRSMGG